MVINNINTNINNNTNTNSNNIINNKIYLSFYGAIAFTFSDLVLWNYKLQILIIMPII